MRRAAQHPDGAAAVNDSTSFTGGSTPCSLAQISRSAGEWQQQLVQQRAALVHPQGLFMHGNGDDRSFSATREMGNGTPPAISR
jgi:hypothetical protein